MQIRLISQSVVALISIALISSLAAVAQQSPALDVNSASPQRTRVLNTKALEVPPSQILWKSEKLFHYRESNWITAENGPFKFSLDIPTFQSFSMPIISDELIYFTYVAENAYFFAIEKETGKKRLVLQFDRNSLSWPAAKGNIVFFGSGRGQVHAYDVANRATKWSFVDKDHSFSSSVPTLDGELLYLFAADRGLYAFVAETGEVKWIFKSSKFINAPAVVGDRVVLVTDSGRLVAVDRNSGATLWDVSVGRDTSSPSILNDQVFLVYLDGEIRAYSTADGSLMWKLKQAPKSGTLLVLYKNMIYYGGREDSVIAIDPITGMEKLRFKTTRPCHSPVIAGDLLYVVCKDKKLYALSPATLAEVWRLDTGKSVAPPPVFANGVMYSLGSDGYMYAMR